MLSFHQNAFYEGYEAFNDGDLDLQDNPCLGTDELEDQWQLGYRSAEEDYNEKLQKKDNIMLKADDEVYYICNFSTYQVKKGKIVATDVVKTGLYGQPMRGVLIAGFGYIDNEYISKDLNAVTRVANTILQRKIDYHRKEVKDLEQVELYC